MELNRFIDFRQEIHQNPELSEKEYQTKKRVINFVQQFSPDGIIEVGNTGIIFSFNGKQPGKSIMVRAELDALPIAEINSFSYKSNNENISHKCGHDGHMVILCRLAYLLSKHRPEKGTVYLLFQPAEENGMGAKEVFNDRAFKKLQIDQVIALHNIPEYPLGSIIIKNNAFTPAVKSIIVKFQGKTSHAAEPEKGINPAAAIAEFIQSSLALIVPQIDNPNFFLVTPVYVSMGEKSYGVSAGYGEVHLTIRSWQNDILKNMSEKLETDAVKIAQNHGLETEIEWTQEFQANTNNADVVERIKKAAQKLDLEIIERKTPMKWGEDFGLFTENFKGAMFGLGAGEKQPALHNPDYDFPDELIKTGSEIFEEIVRTYLNN